MTVMKMESIATFHQLSFPFSFNAETPPVIDFTHSRSVNSFSFRKKLNLLIPLGNETWLLLLRYDVNSSFLFSLSPSARSIFFFIAFLWQRGSCTEEKRTENIFRFGKPEIMVLNVHPFASFHSKHAKVCFTTNRRMAFRYLSILPQKRSRE